MDCQDRWVVVRTAPAREREDQNRIETALEKLALRHRLEARQRPRQWMAYATAPQPHPSRHPPPHSDFAGEVSEPTEILALVAVSR